MIARNANHKTLREYKVYRPKRRMRGSNRKENVANSKQRAKRLADAARHLDIQEAKRSGNDRDEYKARNESVLR